MKFSKLRSNKKKHLWIVHSTDCMLIAGQGFSSERAAQNEVDVRNAMSPGGWTWTRVWYRR